jgi:hypothetical protein
LSVRRDIDVGADVALEILVVGMDQQIAGRDADHLHARLGFRYLGALQLVAHGVELAVEIDRLERQDAVG